MIALKHALPLVRSVQGNAVAFETVWLRMALEEAAGRAGYEGWWLVDDLVAGILQYLRHCYVKTVIDLPELESMVRAALRNTGYGEVAARFRAIPPSQGISLVRCLKRTLSSNRSTFFDQLAETITSLCEAQVRHFHFYDLHACVHHLEDDSDSQQNSRPESLREKIVTFVREHVHSQGWDQRVWCSIS